MSWNSKVVWSEGMFLRPQHFQQHDRYIERLLNGRCSHLRPYSWGFIEFKIDSDMLALGKVAFAAASGVMPDGTPFQIPGDDDAPPPLDVPDDAKNADVYLSLPVRRVGAPEIASGNGDDGLARYRLAEYEARDSAMSGQNDAEVAIGKLSLALTLVDDQSGNFTRLRVARVVETLADGKVVIDDETIPTCLDCRASPRLHGYVTELVGLLRHRAEALAGRLSQAGRGETSNIGDYMLLQAVNRYEPVFAHLARTTGLHPEELYRIGLELGGELATFTHSDRRATVFGDYDHDEPETAFTPLMAELRQSLSMVLEQNAVELPFEDRGYGIRVATVHDRGLLASANFVLAVKADVPNEALINQFPLQAKIGSVEKIADLVNLQLPGIAVRTLPVAPRQIPFHAGFSYFELDRKSEYWSQLDASGGIALYVGGEFPGVELELWAIRE